MKIKIKEFKQLYDESYNIQLSKYVISNTFRCAEFLVKDCCWECETSTLRIAFPTKDGQFSIDDFLDFCRANQPNYGRPKTEESAMNYADSFQILDNKPTYAFIIQLSKKIRGE